MDPLKKELRKKKKKIAELLVPVWEESLCCKFCWEKSSYKMTVHHKWYIENDVIYKNYPNSIEGRIQYYDDLFPLVQKNPERFLYLCIKCHNVLEYWLQFKDIENEIRIELSKKTSYFQYLNNRDSIIVKFILRSLGLDKNETLQHQIKQRPYQSLIKNTKTGLDEFFWN